MKHTALLWKSKNLVPLLFIVFLAAAFLKPQSAQAACAALDTSNGTVTQTVTVPATGTYTVWSRIMAPDTSANSYYLEIDATTCGVNVGDSASIPANTWTWVDYKDGASSSKITATLTAGSHTVRMVGKEAGLKLDRVLFLQDSCTPTSTGDNCTPVDDTTPPSISLTAPAAAATVSGTTTISATASDDTAVTKVTFAIDGTVVSTDTTSPYSYSWNTTTATNASHSIIAQAYDAANNITATPARAVTVNNAPPAQADLVVTAITLSPATPAAGDAVTFSATIKNQGTAATAAGTVHKVLFSVDGTAVNWSDNNTSSLAAGATRTQAANTGSAGVATWLATGGSHTIIAYVDNANLITESNDANNTLSTTFTVTNPDVTSPSVSLTAPANNATISGTTTMTATATDNIGVTRVDFYRGTTLLSSDTTSPYSYSLNTTAIANGSYALTAKAYDAAGNNSTTSITNVTVNNVTVPPPDTTLPTTNITAPTAGAIVSATINVTANATDNVGVSKVELYIDGNLVATDIAAPFAFSWNTTTFTSAAHALTTKAYDAANNVGTSAAVNVTANNSPPPTPKPGDVNGDNAVNILDVSVTLNNYGKSGRTRAQGDLNGDGVVNILDISILLNNWGK